MTIAYIVRCNFNDPAREQAWNDWYSGPKLRQMLAKPHFLTVQRFKRESGRGRDYLAFWTLESEEALRTPEYTSDWGFFEWRANIVDWSRDLFAAEDASDVSAPAVANGGLLGVVSFDHLAPQQAGAVRARLVAEGLQATWMRCVGLDRHSELLGVVRSAPQAGAEAPDVQMGWYTPISPLVRAGEQA